jgi:hypothetical protein
MMNSRTVKRKWRRQIWERPLEGMIVMLPLKDA